jgi:cytochrome c biogenesis factor
LGGDNGVTAMSDVGKWTAMHKRWIVLKAIQFPHINLVWAGTILMVLGFLLSMWRSNAQKKNN